jgi:hypothetical protein
MDLFFSEAKSLGMLVYAVSLSGKPVPPALRVPVPKFCRGTALRKAGFTSS